MSTPPSSSARLRATLPKVLLCAVAAGLYGAAPGAQVEAPVSPAPGMWLLWRTATPQAPTTAPSITLCVDAAGARDPALLMGEAPGDGTCPVQGSRRTDALGLEATLKCPGGQDMKASVRFASGEAFVTRLEAAKAGDRATPARFVHGRRVGSCK